MQQLRSALEAWKPLARPLGDPLSELRSAWPSIVGDDVARHCRPVELNRGALLVLTRSSAWSQQLSFLSERIVSQLNDRLSGALIERLRFRVGRIAAEGSSKNRRTSVRATIPAAGGPPPPAATPAEALARFREAVTRVERAKARAGWKECRDCGARVAPAAGERCLPCGLSNDAQRQRRVAQLLYEAPWLGFSGVAGLVEGLTGDEYEATRRRLLRSWWDTLARIRREGRTHASVRERLIASSYVLLKSGLDPERIKPAVVRDLLGDELHGVIFGTQT